jgi:hypothetical protein
VATSSPQFREISPEFYAAFKLASRDRPGYQIAREHKVEPARLSRILHDRVRPADEPLVLELAARIGVPPAKAFARRRADRRATP